jgi:hypothetical protein
MYDRIKGVLEKPVGEGTHIRIPWFQTPHVMDIRTRPRSVSSVTGTKGELGGPVCLWGPEAAAQLGAGSCVATEVAYLTVPNVQYWPVFGNLAGWLLLGCKVC